MTFGAEKYLFLMALKHDIRFKKISKTFSKETLNTASLRKELDKTFIHESYDKPKKAKSSKSEDNSNVEYDSFLEERNKLFENIDEDFETSKSCYMLTISQFSNTVLINSDSDDEEEPKTNTDDKNETKISFEPFPEV